MKKQQELFDKKKTITAAFTKTAHNLINIREKLLEANGSSHNVQKQLDAIEAQIESYDHAIQVKRSQPMPAPEGPPAPPVGVVGEPQAEVQPAEVPVGDHGNDVAIANVPFDGLYRGSAIPPRD